MTVKDANYLEGLVRRISDAVGEDLRQNGVDKPWVGKLVEANVRPEVFAVLEEIQHRLYQDVISDLLDLARQISPETERK